MSQVLVRDLEPRVVARLKALAHEHGRSLQAELRSILEEAASEAKPGFEEELERLHARFAGRVLDDSTGMIREDRQR